jgi:Cys-rich protein (TIGR01571 family)
MGWCCSAIVLGQLMQRIKLNFLAQPDAEASKNTCMILTVAYGVSYLIGFILAVAMGGAVFTVYPFVIYMIIVITITRMHMRKKYRIPGGVFGDSVLDDCCHAYWCTCCSILQMVRHTHDEKVHQYKFDSKTGLQDDAPDCGGIV